MTKETLREKIIDSCIGRDCVNCYLYNFYDKSPFKCEIKGYEKLKKWVNEECNKRPQCVNGCDTCPIYDSLICLEITE